jgi:ribonuclease P protein component
MSQNYSELSLVTAWNSIFVLMNESFGKDYKLCSQKSIKAVFEDKQSIRSFPYVIHYKRMELENDSPFQITVSVPKRMYKKAHDRNRIKRLMKETIRKNKLSLEQYLTENNLQVALFMIYTSKEEMSFDFLFKKTQKAFTQLINELSKPSSNE